MTVPTGLVRLTSGLVATTVPNSRVRKSPDAFCLALPLSASRMLILNCTKTRKVYLRTDHCTVPYCTAPVLSALKIHTPPSTKLRYSFTKLHRVDTQKTTNKGKVYPVSVMKVCRGSTGKAPLILNLRTKRSAEDHNQPA